ncbi:hypothetical protein ABH904_000786 [Pseudomonas frederiksbergensis]
MSISDAGIGLRKIGALLGGTDCDHRLSESRLADVPPRYPSNLGTGHGVSSRL